MKRYCEFCKQIRNVKTEKIGIDGFFVNLVCETCLRTLNTEEEHKRFDEVCDIVNFHQEMMDDKTIFFIENEEVFLAINKRLEITGGHCPCVPAETYNKDTLCPCKKFREKLECCCNLYKVEFRDKQ